MARIQSSDSRMEGERKTPKGTYIGIVVNTKAAWIPAIV